jgi:diacylglycerol kinase family enzyme
VSQSAPLERSPRELERSSPRTSEGVDLILNRNARRLAGGASALREALVGAAPGTRIHETSSLEDLEAVAARIAARGTACVVLAGGDGSYTAGVTALARAFGPHALPPIALAPGGTVSTVARNWGLPGPSASYAARLMRAASERTAEWVQRPTLHVRDDRGGDSIGFIFGAGLVSRFFEEYEASPHKGYAGAARIVARIFAGSFRPKSGGLAQKVLTPIPCTLHVEGERAAASSWSLITASVVPNLGLSMRLTYRAGGALDHFHAVASPLPPHRLGPQMPRVLFGRPLRNRDGIDALTRALDVRFPTDDAYVLDGELRRARGIRVQAGPPIRVLRLPP